MYAVILAGGGGTRLWPLSRPECPKPFLPLIGDRTLLQRTWDRIVPELVAAGDVAVVTDRRYVDIVRQQLPGLREDMLLAEPVGRNTAAAVAFAAAALDRSDDDVMLVLPADHLVADEPGFRDILRRAASARRSSSARRRTGSPGHARNCAGRTGDRLRLRRRRRPDPRSRRGGHVARFVEKPSVDDARAMLAGPTPVAWNAGIFLWRRDALRAAFEAGSPDILADVEAGVAGGPERLEAAYARLRATSIDYAVLEPAARRGASRCSARPSAGATSGAGAHCATPWRPASVRARTAGRRRGPRAAKRPRLGAHARPRRGSADRHDRAPRHHRRGRR